MKKTFGDWAREFTDAIKRQAPIDRGELNLFLQSIIPVLDGAYQQSLERERRANGDFQDLLKAIEENRNGLRDSMRKALL